MIVLDGANGASGDVTSLAIDTLTALRSMAVESPRRRQHLNLHRSYDEPCQRFLNALRLDSYVRPHRHRLDPKDELMIAVAGAFALLSFDETGGICAVTPFGTEKYWGHDAPFGVVVPPTTWHSILALTEDAVLLEVKAGPFDPGLAKEFASWAPDEADAAAGQVYLAKLRTAALSDAATLHQLTLSACP